MTEVRFNLFQLERDARKPGAWQARLVYAKWLKENNQKEKAIELLKQIPTDSKYKHEANLLLAKWDKSTNGIVLENLQAVIKERTRPDTFSVTQMPTEIYYKKMRSQYDLGMLTEREYIKKISTLLDAVETTDTLIAKVYFQLIRAHINAAKKTGDERDLIKAREYALALTESPELKEMNKANLAAQVLVADISPINRETRTISKKFLSYADTLYNTGVNASAAVFKYAGVVLGNIFDLLMFTIPKIMTSDWDTFDSARGFFLESGFASGGNRAGKSLGKVLGKFISGPLTTFLGCLAFPLVYAIDAAMNKNAVKEEVKAMANTIADLNKPNGNYPTNFFAYKKANTPNQYGGINYEELKGIMEDAKKTHTLKASNSSANTAFAYARLFSKPVAPKAAPIASQPAPQYGNRH